MGDVRRFYVDANNYRHIRMPGHHRSVNGFVREHIVLAEKMIGRPIAKGEIVHHTDLAKGTINPFGLIVCVSHEAHMSLHREIRALAATGDKDMHRCHICHTYDSKGNLAGDRVKGFRHRSCHNAKTKRPNKTGRVVKVGQAKPKCDHCGEVVTKSWGEINRAAKRQAKVFCGRLCFSLALAKDATGKFTSK